MTVENVNWDLELSTLTEIINERSKTRPAIIFDRIKDYPPGYRVAANPVSSVDRLAMTLGSEDGWKITAENISGALRRNQRRTIFHHRRGPLHPPPHAGEERGEGAW